MNMCDTDSLRQRAVTLQASDEWQTTALQQRMAIKQAAIHRLMNATGQNWAQAFYITLAHDFGFHTNGTAFEALALKTPLSCLQKHRNSLFQLTAILLGQSGLLYLAAPTKEKQQLLSEYLFLKQKFSLDPMDATLWHSNRFRPNSTPEVRIRQFAQLLYQSEFLFAQLMEEEDISKMTALLQLRPLPSTVTDKLKAPPALGTGSIRVLLINSVIPYKYAYAMAQHDNTRAAFALQLLEKIPPENNAIIRRWKAIGVSVHSAADTQALLQLTTQSPTKRS